MNEETIVKIYSDLLTNWNNQDATAMSLLFTADGSMIGFDGSQINGQIQIESELSQIFSHHPTARYIFKVQEVRLLSAGVVLLRAIAGMILPGKKVIDPSKNVIQSLIVVNHMDQWKISLFQNTPAQFHGRPVLVDEMTKELSSLI